MAADPTPRPNSIDWPNGACVSPMSLVGSDPFFVFYVVIGGRAIGGIPNLGAQVIDLFAELGRFVHGRFCTAEQTADAVRVA